MERLSGHGFPLYRAPQEKRWKRWIGSRILRSVGSTPFANEYEFEFAKELMLYENVGRGPATDLLSISLSPNDILGHQVGPDSPEMQQMALDLDRELADFINFLGHQIGLANVWIALSADHGVSSLPDTVKKLTFRRSISRAEKLEERSTTG